MPHMFDLLDAAIFLAPLLLAAAILPAADQPRHPLSYSGAPAMSLSTQARNAAA